MHCYEYFYIRNQMGDITHIATSDGTVVVHYIYDAYGQIIDTEITAGYSAIADANPYRYRGYRYDLEISMYYLNSRYYNPEVGRFINADDVFGNTNVPTSNNVYSYGLNNPIMFSDESGAWPKLSTIFTAIAVAAAAVAVVALVVAVAPVMMPALAAAGVSAVGAGSTLASVALTVATGAVYTSVASTVLAGASYLAEENTKNPTIDDSDKPNVKYPGDDPNVPPGEDFEWKGKGSPESGKGNWVNKDTGEWYHPDLNHGEPIGPHWDYGQKGTPGEWWIFPDGTVLPK
ncbi:MAG: RHS repeat-associated core domain-containing protein [Candidatus Izemoplasmatales bacterium]|nr:RHS repeat-associated core domain-containing protein [Candidatus Izemoplasmatales bacterium]